MATLTERVWNGIRSESVAADLINMAEIAAFNNSYQEQLRRVSETEVLDKQLQQGELKLISSFGRQAADGIGKLSDTLLVFLHGTRPAEADQVLILLTELVGKFDLESLQRPTRQGLWQKFWPAEEMDNTVLLRQYDLLALEIDKVYVVLKRYQDALRKDIQTVQVLYAANLSCYQALESSIIAGQSAIVQWGDQVETTQSSNPALARAEAEYYAQAREMLSQQIVDLQIAEKMALQNIVLLQKLQYNQYSFERKISVAVDKTLLTFKQMLAQAVLQQQQLAQLTHLQKRAELTQTQQEILLKIRQAILVSIDEVNTALTENEQLRQAISIKKDRRLAEER